MPAILWAALIFALSSRPTVPLPAFTHIDKLAHFAAYAVLGLLLAWGQDRSRVLSPRWMVLIGVLYGVSDEFHQSFVPGRAAELGDLIADSLGVLAGVGGYQLWRRTRARNEPRQTSRSSRPLVHD